MNVGLEIEVIEPDKLVQFCQYHPVQRWAEN